MTMRISIALLGLFLMASCSSLDRNSDVAKLAGVVGRVKNEALHTPGVYCLQFFCEPHPQYVWMEYSSSDRKLLFRQFLTGEGVDYSDWHDAFGVLLSTEQVHHFDKVLGDHGLSTNRQVTLDGTTRWLSYDNKDLSDRQPEAVARFVSDIFKRVYRYPEGDRVFCIVYRLDLPQPTNAPYSSPAPQVQKR